MPYVYEDNVREDIPPMIPPDGKVIASLGCGTAATEAVLVQQGREVHGLDIAPEAIAIASRRLTSARVVSVGDPCPFAAESLDGLIFADVLEHLPHAWSVLADYARALRKGGWVVISVPNMRSVDVFQHFILGGDWPEHPMGLYDATHIQMMSRKRLIRWCNAAGLQVERWFDRYDPRGPRRTPFMIACDRLSLKIFHSWFMYQLQCVARKS